MADDPSKAPEPSASARRQDDPFLNRPIEGVPASLIVDIVHGILTREGVDFAADPKPFIGRMTAAVLRQVSPAVTVNRVITIVLEATCTALGIEYTFDPKH